MEYFCIKCLTKREISEAQEITMNDGRKAIKGKCPVCGINLCKIEEMKKDISRKDKK